MPHPYPKHLDGFSYRGLYRYSLTFCTDGRRRLFTSADLVALVWSQILRAASEEKFAVLAYCFMPDHVHLLVEGLADSSDCKRFIKKAKQLSGFYCSQHFDIRPWQRFGFERVLRNDEMSLVVARYIVANPLRAGLVKRVEDYPFIGSTVYTRFELLEGVSSSA